MTQDDSEEHEGSEETRRDEIGEENNGDEVNERRQLVYKTDREYKHETPKDNNGETHAHGDKQREFEDGECGMYEREGLEFGEDRGYTSSRSPNTNLLQHLPIRPHPMQPQTNCGSSTGRTTTTSRLAQSPAQGTSTLPCPPTMLVH